MRVQLTNLTFAMALATLAVSVPVVWHSRGCIVAGPQINANGTVTPGSITCGDRIANQIVGSVDNRTGPAEVTTTLPTVTPPLLATTVTLMATATATTSTSVPESTNTSCVIQGPVCDSDGKCTAGSINCGLGILDQAIAAADAQD